jgi:hypothetical protein
MLHPIPPPEVPPAAPTAVIVTLVTPGGTVNTWLPGELKLVVAVIVAAADPAPTKPHATTTPTATSARPTRPAARFRIGTNAQSAIEPARPSKSPAIGLNGRVQTLQEVPPRNS